MNGKGYDLVAHLVHADADRHLAVVGILFKAGTANPFVESVWKNIPAEKEKAVDVASVSVNVKDLLPSDPGYYTFTGSLTIPPCSEGVTWYVLKSIAQLSAEQLAAFAKIYPLNARPSSHSITGKFSIPSRVLRNPGIGAKSRKEVGEARSFFALH